MKKAAGQRGVESVNVTGRVHPLHGFESVFGEYTEGCSLPGKRGQGVTGRSVAAGRLLAGRSVPTGKNTVVPKSLRD
jgi:hypothetical protein